MSEAVPFSSSSERSPVVASHFVQIRSRLVAIAAMVLSVAGCAASPESVSPRGPARNRAADSSGGVWISQEPDRVSAPPLSEAELRAEGAAFRSAFLQGRAIRQQVRRIAELRESFKTAEGDAKEALSQELAQASFDLEVTAFNLFGDVRRANPRCWARLLRVLRAVTDGSVTVENIDGLALEQFGEIESSPDTSVSRKAMLGLYTEEVKFLAFMVARLDRSLGELRRQFDDADPAARENLSGMIHALEKQQSDLMGLIEAGDIFPVVPPEAERASWEQRIFEVFLETRQQAGGQEGLPGGIRFGGAQQPQSHELQQIEPVKPSETPTPAPPVPTEPAPEQQQAPRQDYRPRVV